MFTFKLFQILTAEGAICQMCTKRFLTSCLLGCLFLVGLASANDTNNPKVRYLPKTARALLAARFPSWAVVSESDLTEHDQILWRAKLSHFCQGIAVGDYFGNRATSYAITLVNRQPTKTLQTLIVLKPSGDSYELIELSKPQETSRTLVVFRVGPDRVEDIKTGESVKTTSDAIAYECIAAGMLVCAWQNGRFKEIRVSE